MLMLCTFSSTAYGVLWTTTELLPELQWPVAGLPGTGLWGLSHHLQDSHRQQAISERSLNLAVVSIKTGVCVRNERRRGRSNFKHKSKKVHSLWVCLFPHFTNKRGQKMRGLSLFGIHFSKGHSCWRKVLWKSGLFFLFFFSYSESSQ